MDTLNLPDELKQFLQSGQQLDFNAAKCETGTVALNDLAELKVVTFHL